MQHPGTDTIFSSPWWGREEQTASVYVPMMIRTMVSHNSSIPAFDGNPV